MQLNGNGKGATYNNPQDRSKRPRNPPTRFSYDDGNFPGLRWAQSAGFGFSPNRAQPNTFQAIILDTADSGGGIHSPFKEAAGTRLARAALKQVYGMSAQQVAQGPVLGSVSARAPAQNGSVTVTLRSAGGGVELHTDGKLGFEALPAEAHPYAAHWQNIPIVVHGKDSLTLGGVPANATRIRYLWYSNACGLELFKCPVYTAVAPLKGGLSGEHGFLPLGPFLADIPSS